MVLSSDAHESLPVVQIAKISYTGTQGVVESQTVSKPDQLPTALISALNQATHTTIDGQPADEFEHIICKCAYPLGDGSGPGQRLSPLSDSVSQR